MRVKAALAIMAIIIAFSLAIIIGLAAPLNESPQRNSRTGILLTSLFILVAGAIVSFFVSGIVTKPYKVIQKQMEEIEHGTTELEVALKAAKDANNAKTNFLASMSHDMRTPLNAILGLSELMIETGEAQREYQINLEKINYAGMALLGMVNDILDISKIEAG